MKKQTEEKPSFVLLRFDPSDARFLYERSVTFKTAGLITRLGLRPMVRFLVKEGIEGLHFGKQTEESIRLAKRRLGKKFPKSCFLKSAEIA
jgi:hypothetical protein